MEYSINDEVLSFVKDVESEPLEAYVGPFTFEAINERLVSIKQFLKKNEPDRQKYKRVYSVLVEMTENVIKHSLRDDEHRESAFLLYKEGGRYTLYVANFVSNEDGESITSRVGLLSGKTQEELKAMKITQLKEGQISDRGGAGLGLIEIAMKVQGDVNCKMKNIDEQASLLVMIINIA